MGTTTSLRILSADDVRAALPMAEAIQSMRDAFTQLHRGDAHIPQRGHLDVPNTSGMTLTMPGVMTNPTRIGWKLLTIYPENPGRGRPFVHGVVVMFDPKTGRPAGLIEAGTLTALRTGAASGLATKYLARRGARSVAILGSGTQARTQLEAVCCVRKICDARVYSRTRAHAARFAKEMVRMPDTPDRIHVASSAAVAADGADIVCTATTATVPILGAGDVAPGTHINAVGSYTPDMKELGPALIHGATVVVDSREAALAESGELMAAVGGGLVDPDGLLELGEIVTGDHPGREHSGQITIFKSVGLAVQDLCAADRALRRAQRLGLGGVVPL